jgi:6-phosphogluconolactonase
VSDASTHRADRRDRHGQGRRPDRAYIGSFTSAGGRGVTAAAVDQASGALTVLHHTDTAVPDPSYLTLDAEREAGGTLLYAVSETESGAVAAFSLADPDRPEPAGEPAPVKGADPTHLTVAGGHIVTANYGSGSVSSLPLRADGTLGGQATVHPHQGGGPNAERQEGPHAHAVVPDPHGRWLLAVDLGTDSVWVYALTRPGDGDGSGASAGALHPHHEVPLREGTGPRHLAFHPDGAHAYVVNELESTVTVCRWDPEEGRLRPVGETPTVPDGAARETNYPSELVVSGDGRYIWVANRGHDSIAVLDLAESGDRLDLVGTVPCGGHWPRDLALHPSGERLYAANERSGDVTWFDLDPQTGVPRRSGSLAVAAASCVVFG